MHVCGVVHMQPVENGSHVTVLLYISRYSWYAWQTYQVSLLGGESHTITLLNLHKMCISSMECHSYGTQLLIHAFSVSNFGNHNHYPLSPNHNHYRKPQPLLEGTSLANKLCSSMTLLCCLHFYKFRYSWYA